MFMFVYIYWRKRWRAWTIMSQSKTQSQTKDDHHWRSSVLITFLFLPRPPMSFSSASFKNASTFFFLDSKRFFLDSLSTSFPSGDFVISSVVLMLSQHSWYGRRHVTVLQWILKLTNEKRVYIISTSATEDCQNKSARRQEHCWRDCNLGFVIKIGKTFLCLLSFSIKIYFITHCSVLWHQCRNRFINISYSHPFQVLKL